MRVDDPAWKPENWHRERKPVVALWRKLTLPLQLAANWPEVAKLKELENRFAGERIFLLGNGPSLAEQDLSKLKDEKIATVNMGLRMLEHGVPHATFHVMSGINRFRRFGEEIETDIIRYQVPWRFYRLRLKSTWQRLPQKGTRPYFVPRRAGTLLTTGFQDKAWMGIGSDATVLLFAVQLFYFLGFEAVYVMGCDLSYSGQDHYFYKMGEKDYAHEQDPKVIAARASMARTNAQFEIAGAAYKAGGRILANAGHGGNLDAIDRVDFESLFSGP
ncbi:MAG: hypothetical protein KDJ77_16070 [Rhodobiaceae bacterium]|nr:hypothetical protein [Rhodobiaceae bacterium]